MNRWVLTVAALLMFGRLFVTPGEITLTGVYKAAAHLFIGGLFVACCREPRALQRAQKWCLFAGLCGWELVIAICSRWS
mgnify:CR=1 FL=1